MEHTAGCRSHLSLERIGFHPIVRLAELRRNNTLGHVAAVLVFIGLAFAIATDGQLPLMWSRALFASLAVLDALMIDWLIR